MREVRVPDAVGVVFSEGVLTKLKKGPKREMLSYNIIVYFCFFNGNNTATSRSLDCFLT